MAGFEVTSEEMLIIVRQVFVGGKGVGVKDGARFNVLPHFGLECILFAIRDDAGTNLPATLHNPNQCGLVFAPRSR
jgi:hypothetical protein